MEHCVGNGARPVLDRGAGGNRSRHAPADGVGRVVGRGEREPMRPLVRLRDHHHLIRGHGHAVGRGREAVVHLGQHRGPGLDRGAHPADFGPEHQPVGLGAQRRHQHVGPEHSRQQARHRAQARRHVAHPSGADRVAERVPAHRGAHVGECLGVVEVDRCDERPPEQRVRTPPTERAATDSDSRRPTGAPAPSAIATRQSRKRWRSRRSLTSVTAVATYRHPSQA